MTVEAKKANVSNHETSPLGRNKMSQLFFVQLMQDDRLKMIKFPPHHPPRRGRNPIEFLASKIGILGRRMISKHLRQ